MTFLQQMTVFAISAAEETISRKPSGEARQWKQNAIIANHNTEEFPSDIRAFCVPHLYKINSVRPEFTPIFTCLYLLWRFQCSWWPLVAEPVHCEMQSLWYRGQNIALKIQRLSDLHSKNKKRIWACFITDMTHMLWIEAETDLCFYLF